MRNKRSSFKPHGLFLGLVSALTFGVLFGAAWLMVDTMKKMNGDAIAQSNEEIAQVLAREPIEITLKRMYVCGTEEEEKLTASSPSPEQILNEYKDWDLVSEGKNGYVFEKFVHDLSPVCKENGYFGLTNDDVLTLFEGPPHEQKVIQTFFQIKTEKFESGLFKNDLDLLKQGIRIRDLSEYNSILSTYGEYADENLSSTKDETMMERWS